MIQHLLTVWNPSYASDAMDAHLDVLLAWARRRAEGQGGDDDVYAWWAKLRSANRQQPLPHKAEVLALDAQIQAGAETHLYLTDYRSLYVGQLGEITGDDVRDDAGERDHMPRYYTQGDLHTDFWFRLFDIRRLVADDTVAVVEELKRLRNLRYHDRPVSIYGGITELPLIVRRDGEEAGWFADRGSLIEERLWAERDGRLRGETERLAADLRDNLIGRTGWAALQLATRSFLATAEAVFRRHRDDPHFDFATAAVEYAKAIEVELNALLRPGLQALESGHHSLGAIARWLADPPPPFCQVAQRHLSQPPGHLHRRAGPAPRRPRRPPQPRRPPRAGGPRPRHVAPRGNPRHRAGGADSAVGKAGGGPQVTRYNSP